MWVPESDDPAEKCECFTLLFLSFVIAKNKFNDFSPTSDKMKLFLMS